MRRVARSRVAAAAAWAVTRAFVLAVWLPAVPQLHGDVTYYWLNTAALVLGEKAPAQAMIEYPTPVLWVLRLPFALSGGSQAGFMVAFVALMVAIDLALTVLLWQRGTGRTAVWFWIAVVVAMGPITYLRLDLVPAALCAVALLSLRRGGGTVAGVSLAAGAGLKLWPALLWPFSLSGRRDRDRASAISFATGGVVIVVASVLYAGWGRLVSPLAWQSGRGLQIESVWATPLMILRVGDPALHPVDYSAWQAYEVFGPGVEFWLAVASAVTAVSYLGILAGCLMWLRRVYRLRLPTSAAASGLAMVTVITILLVANKTLSPQYLVWLAAPFAVLLAMVPRLRPLAGYVLILAVLTQCIYPALYGQLLSGGSGSLFAVAVLTARNVGLLGLCCLLVVRSVRLLTPSADL